MTNATLHQCRRIDVGILFLALLGALYVFAATWEHGLATGPDMMHYVSAARSFVAGDGFLRPNGDPMTQWPPGYSVLLAAGTAFGSVLRGGIWVHAVLFAAVIGLSGIWLRRTRMAGPLVLAGTAAVLLGTPLTHYAVEGSEMAFLAFELAAILCLGRFLATRSSAWLWGAALCIAAASLTRYVGVVLLGTAAILLLACSSAWRRGLVRAFLVALPTGVGMGLWVLRNVLLTGAVAGPRAASRDTLAVNLWRVANTWSLWLLPNEIPASARVFTVVVLLVAGGGGVAAVYRNADGGRSWREWIRRTWGNEGIVAGVFVLIYVAFLVGVTTQVAVASIGGRLLVPTYVPLVVLSLQSLSVLASAWNGTIGPISSTQGLAILVGVWLLYPGGIAAKRLLLFSQTGTGGASNAVWDDFHLFRSIEKLPEGPIFSNEPHILYFRKGISAQIVRQTYWRSPTRAPGRNRFAGAVASATGAVVVWLEETRANAQNSHLLPLDSLLAMGKVDTLATAPHGGIYRVRKPPPSADAAADSVSRSGSEGKDGRK